MHVLSEGGRAGGRQTETAKIGVNTTSHSSRDTNKFTIQLQGSSPEHFCQISCSAAAVFVAAHPMATTPSVQWRTSIKLHPRNDIWHCCPPPKRQKHGQRNQLQVGDKIPQTQKNSRTHLLLSPSTSYLILAVPTSALFPQLPHAPPNPLPSRRKWGHGQSVEHRHITSG